MKINVIMPTYNDAKTIRESLDSIKKQTYEDWKLVIVNDGSTDSTETIIKEYIQKNSLQNKIIYIYQENADQLNAIKRGLNEIVEEESLIYILHSDDVLNNEYVFECANKYFIENNNVDAIISDYNIINKKSEIIGDQKVKKYKKKASTIALQGLWLGRNLFVDVGFFKYKVYKKYIYQNYLTWNRPFWLIAEDKLDMLNVKNVNFPFFKYRVFEENYINNEIGVLNVLNGELRTAITIFKKIDIPLYKIQYIIFRLLNKLNLTYIPIYINKETSNIYEKIKFIINKRITDEDLEKYEYYTSILNFFKNKKERTIKINNINSQEVFLGSDARLFNKKMLDKQLPKVYYKLFDEMNKGFDCIETDENSYKNLVNILKFMDIYDYIKIKTKGKKA